MPVNTSNNVVRFLAYVKPYRWALFASTMVGIIKYNLPVVFPWILKDVIDNVLAGKESVSGLTFDQLMILSLGIFALYSVITYLRTFIADRLAHQIMFDVRKDLFQHIQKLPIDFFQKNQTGAIISRLITDVSKAQDFVNMAGTNVFMDLTNIAAITFLVFFMNWKLGLIAYSIIPIYALIQRQVNGKMHEKATEARRRMDAVEGRLHEAVSGISDIKSFTHESEETRRFEVRSRGFLEAVIDSIKVYAVLLGSTALLTRLTSVLVIWIGGSMVLGDSMTVGSLMAIYAYLEMIYTPLNRISEMNIYYANSRAAIDRLFEFFDQKHEPQEEQSQPLSVCRGKIEFRNVHFDYANNGDRYPLFRGVDLLIPAGWRVALVGPSGAGKSTLIKLLVRFFDPHSGSILIDGQDIRNVNLKSLRSQISVVQQDLMLFSGTVEENIRLGKPDASFKEILRAAEMANARGFIESLPKKFQTEIGERGIRLSGGQKQLIAITRAFLKDAPILILDESTSNMDSPSERLIYEALQRLMKDRTTIIIAHRLSTVSHADMIIVLDQGKVVQQGTHEKLLRSAKGMYRNLYSNAFTGVRQSDMQAIYIES